MVRSGDEVNNLLCVLLQEPDIVELAHVYVQDEKLISCAASFNHLCNGLLQFSAENSKGFEYILCWYIGYSAW